MHRLQCGLKLLKDRENKNQTEKNEKIHEQSNRESVEQPDKTKRESMMAIEFPIIALITYNFAVS